jgi:hypothetical protein
VGSAILGFCCSLERFFEQNKYQINVRFQVLMAAYMEATFLDVVPCSLVQIGRRFKAIYCLHQGLMMETVSTSEMSVNFYDNAMPNIPENSRL